MEKIEAACVRDGGGGISGFGGAILAFLSTLALAAVPATAQNLVWNGSFGSDVGGWSLLAGDALLWTNLVDEGDCGASGAALVTSHAVGSEDVATIGQCVGDLPGGGSIHVRARHQGYGLFSIEVVAYGTVDCESGTLGSAGSPFAAQSPTEWSSTAFDHDLPPTAHSVLVRLTAVDFDPHGLVVDGVEVTLAPSLFLDGFEGNDAGDASPCRWN